MDSRFGPRDKLTREHVLAPPNLKPTSLLHRLVTKIFTGGIITSFDPRQFLPDHCRYVSYIRPTTDSEARLAQPRVILLYSRTLMVQAEWNQAIPT